VMLVTLQQARDHLRSDTTDDDNDLTLKIMAASSAIEHYLRSHGSVYVQAINSNGDPEFDTNGDEISGIDSNGDMVIKPEVQMATLLLVGELYKSREGEMTGLDSYSAFGQLPRAVVLLLYPLRDPVIG
jgi:hypothetical protein